MVKESSQTTRAGRQIAIVTCLLADINADNDRATAYDSAQKALVRSGATLVNRTVRHRRTSNIL